MALVSDLEVVGAAEEFVVASLGLVGNLRDELDAMAFWGKLR